MPSPELTVLSFGAGQESTALLYLFLREKGFREKWAPGRLLVLGCDTGDEHPETYAHVRFCAELCAKHGVEFIWATYYPEKSGFPSWAAPGFHSDAWPSLTAQFKRNSSMGSRQYARTCTDNLKIGPFYRALAWYAAGKPMEDGRAIVPDKKKTFEQWTASNGRIRVMLGFAKGEENRARKTTATLAKVGKGQLPAWRRNSFEVVFPLIDDPQTNWNRKESQDAMRALGLPVPVPSNCLRCHFRGPVELLWLKRNHPAAFEEWVQIETAKIEKYRARGLPDSQNNGVYGKRTLLQELAEAEKKFGHMSMEQLEDYRMSHGHCVSNAF